MAINPTLTGLDGCAIISTVPHHATEERNCNMDFERVCLDTWARKEHFLHYFSQVPCTYSLTTKLDITPIMEEKLYPTMLYLIARAVNRYPEFRMDLDGDGNPGPTPSCIRAIRCFTGTTRRFPASGRSIPRTTVPSAGLTNRTWHSLGTTMA